MKKNKYINKDILCKYNLSYNFLSGLGIKVNDVIPLRKVFLLHTDSGNKILKKVDYSIEKVNYINDCLNYVRNKYNNIIEFNIFDDGKCYKEWENDIYILMDVMEGHECSFYNPIEIQMCAENIAMLHKASYGLREYIKNIYSKDPLDISLIEKYKNAYNDLIKIKNIVSKYEYKNEFDIIFMNNIDKYSSEINSCIEKLNNSEYLKLRIDNSKVSLCHNDLAYHNFLINNDEVSILDFDYMTIDLRINDLSDFIIKSIKNVAFDNDKMKLILNSYEKINKLSLEEKNILKILLAFPKDFYTISTDYYNKKKSWNYEVFLNRLVNKMENEKFRYELLKEIE